MTEFLQLHVLTAYPPSNLNRDDLGRPKTAVLGGANRLRISSQSLKRAWRTSDLFAAALAGHIGIRTKEMGTRVLAALLERGVPEKTARSAAEKIAGVFGKLKAAAKPAKDEGGEEEGAGDGAERRAARGRGAKKGATARVETEQLAHFSPEEVEAIDRLVERLTAERRDPTPEELLLLKKENSAADVALFGRMMAAAPDFNVEAAAQVAHAITVHRTEVEDDFFSAVDDLNRGEDDRGAGHLGEAEFAAGLFYLYLCIDRDLLLRNLGGDQPLAMRTLRALLEAVVKVPPSGKQASFASRAYASYVLAEKGRMQPRSLAVAYLKPVAGEDYLAESIANLGSVRRTMDAVYGPTSEASYVLDATAGEGTLAGLLDFVGAPLAEA